MSRRFLVNTFIYTILSLLVPVFYSSSARAQEAHDGEAQTEEFDPGETILHHVGDEHQWHLATVNQHHYAIPLPVILYTASRGLNVYSSGQFYHGTGEHDGFKLDHEHFSAVDGSAVYDFSITKNAASLIISFVLLLGMFFAVANAYRSRVGKAPRGLQSAVEPFIVFIRDEVAKNYIGEKHYQRFLPYLLTLFFFIWLNNLLGLLPGSANLTGNIAVTMVLAVLTFIIVTVNGKKTYWRHVFAMPGVPWYMLIILTPVELAGVLMRPVSLMIRLFANMTAGHIILLSLLSMIFIFKSSLLGIIVGPFSVFMYLIELVVSVLQAYIFTVLTASYIGAALEEEHHDAH